MAYSGNPWAGNVLPLEDPPYYPLLKYSRKDRRVLSNSDDEIIQEQDTRCTAIRRGWPTLPPLPVNTFIENISQRVKNAGQHLAKVNTILKVQNIEAHNVCFAYRLPMDEEPNDINVQDVEYLTLLVTLDMKEYGERLGHSIIRIRAEFKKSPDTCDYMIEFFDFRAGPAGPTSMPITTTQRNIINAWEKTADIIISNHLNGKRWLSLECVMRGLGEDENTFMPTFVITVPNAKDDDWWNNVLPTIREDLTSQNYLKKFRVLFGVDLLQGTTLLCVPTRERRPKTFRVLGAAAHPNTHAYGEQLPMGVSIGLNKEDPKLDPSSGTMGGIIQLKGPQNTQKLGMTNWHVVDDKYLVAAAKSSTTGSFLKRAGAPDVKLVSPSNMDHTNNVDTTKNALQRWQGLIGTQNNAAMRVAETEKRLKDISSTARMMGSVVAGSGLRDVEAHRYRDQNANENAKKIIWTLDWAVFTMGKRKANNSVLIAENDFPASLSDKGHSTRLLNGLLADTWAQFRLSYDHDDGEHPLMVAKCGRTSGWTFGKVNATIAKINPREDEEISKKYKYTNETFGEVWAVGSRSPDQHFLFLRKGDSGSICIFDPVDPCDTQVGAWLGLLFGYTALGQGIMSPMDLVIQDIEDVTKFKVTLPRKGVTVSTQIGPPLEAMTASINSMLIHTLNKTSEIPFKHVWKQS
ncbi:hypothetical protein PMIN01_10964 [Paraphaeosphaeria minitans]|uniref:Uncharacterized protein n=1 Tax=Paraphaeosphaeria minitans TaxID=565426 RepID=A0A9P6KLU5_9PLEO|nr:hypothetical protein PMIN01_10964 [Paraphaeosphaeria minitans]